MSNFTTNEVASLEKDILLTEDLRESNLSNIDDIYEINKCAEWINFNKFKNVCLQFPNYLLPDSTEVVKKLQEILSETMYLLADTTYESCCIDYIAASHINADAIIHYGPICFSRTIQNIPFLNIYEKHKLDTVDFKTKILQTFEIHHCINIIVDTPYIYCFEDILLTFKECQNIKIYRIDANIILSENTVIFLGKNQRKLINIQLNFNVKDLYYYDGVVKRCESNSKLLNRRHYLVEKIKDSNVIGIIIGTLGVANYLNVIKRIKKIISLNSKKYYIISVGKPTVAKLANFPEMDIYVAVTCSMSEIYESRDFYKPIATPFDLEMALNSNFYTTTTFSYDYNHFLKENFNVDELVGNQNLESDISLLTNNIRLYKSEDIVNKIDSFVIKDNGTISVNSNYGIGYLSERSWQGLEQSLGQTDVELAQEGITGIAQKYKNEQP